MKIILGVTGGIAAYKAAELLREFQQREVAVRVVMTRRAQEFIRPLTFAALSGQPVITELFPAAGATSPADFESSIEHIAVAQSADALVIAPATANTLARLAHGFAGDFLGTLYLACPAPVIVAPAMNVEMWNHPATQENAAKLRSRGVVIVEPETGALACGMTGAGRLAALSSIVDAALAAVERRKKEQGSRRDLSGEAIVITAGPTREYLDPVRFLSNRSSGRMGYALAQAAAERGADVILITGPVSVPAPMDARVSVVPVVTAEEMADATLRHVNAASVAILAAAVADYRPATVAPLKLKKAQERVELELVRNRDILAELGQRSDRPLLIGFAAETGADIEAGRTKLRAKNADLIVFNDVSRPGIGFDSEANAVTLLSHWRERAVPTASKREIADQILDEALLLREWRGAASEASGGNR